MSGYTVMAAIRLRACCCLASGRVVRVKVASPGRALLGRIVLRTKNAQQCPPQLDFQVVEGEKFGLNEPATT